MSQEFRFSLLGPVRVTAGGTEHPLRGPKANALLALLLLNRSHVVDVATLVDELWEHDPPRHAVSTVRTHVYHLRRALGAAGVGGVLATRPPGYTAEIGPDRLDTEVFTRLVADGRRALAAGRHRDAADSSAAALRAWRGRPLENVAGGRLLRGHVRRLEELRVQALEQRVEARMRMGEHRALVPELRDLVAAHPLNEWFHARLIEALHRSGRRADALVAFLEVREVLDAELGVPPSAELHALQHSILADDPHPGAGARRAVLAAAP
ncbi:AfsR/SARP family transcriptional regulator [Nocardiopsis trehalosi]|jgi:DNA-binding SARP family transcriptional activator|uniref:AfsR/SARP family transcriptional regulator n=1 Tax=Nocardiopsis trehalosi TaxID=109329 RepID=UPI00083302E2|nr:AfsR/SARP family transcriptional regulator [Nocardiopsis trehalosi]